MPRSPEAVAPVSGPAAETVLTDEMLARFAKRAPQYDRDNTFFADDFDEAGFRDEPRLRPRIDA